MKNKQRFKAIVQKLDTRTPDKEVINSAGVILPKNSKLRINHQFNKDVFLGYGICHVHEESGKENIQVVGEVILPDYLQGKKLYPAIKGHVVNYHMEGKVRHIDKCYLQEISLSESPNVDPTIPPVEFIPKDKFDQLSGGYPSWMDKKLKNELGGEGHEQE